MSFHQSMQGCGEKILQNKCHFSCFHGGFDQQQRCDTQILKSIWCSRLQQFTYVCCFLVFLLLLLTKVASRYLFFCHGHQDWGMGKKKMDGGPCCRLMCNWLKNKSYWSYQGKCLLVKGREEKKQGEGEKKVWVYLWTVPTKLQKILYEPHK